MGSVAKMYSLSLRVRLPLKHKQLRQIHHLAEPEEGSIIIVKDKSLPRSNWKLGRILHLLPKQKVRSAEILLPV